LAAGMKLLPDAAAAEGGWAFVGLTAWLLVA